MNNSEPFGPWVEPMTNAGAVNPRNGRPSWTQLAARAGLSVSAVTNTVYGRTRAEAPTVQKIAKALRVKPETVSDWLGTPKPVRGPYIPVDESALLSPHERDALDLLIRAIARGRDTQEGATHGHPTPTTAPPVDRAALLRELTDRGLTRKEAEAALDGRAEPVPERAPRARRRGVSGQSG